MLGKSIPHLTWFRGFLLVWGVCCSCWAADELSPARVSETGTDAGSLDRGKLERMYRPKVPSGVSPLKLTGEPIVEFIDSEIRKQWELHQIPPSDYADEEEWFRRVTLDVVGHIPALEETENFLKDQSPDKRKTLLEKLLDSPDYARNWASLWTNLLIGRKTPDRIDRDGLRNFLETSFRNNLPWDRLVYSLISAEGSQRDNGAVNFLLAHLNDSAVPATSLTAKLFLGTQLQCTQCHNHPFNEWKQNQFWELNSFFSQTRRFDHQKLNPETNRLEFEYAELIFVDGQGPVHFEQRNGLVKVAYPIYEGVEIPPDNTTNRRLELAKLLVRPESDQLSKAMANRMWGHFFGVGFTRPIDDLGPHRPPSHPQVLEKLAVEFRQRSYDLKQLIRWICASEAYQLTSRAEKANVLDDPAQGSPPKFTHMPVKAFSPEQVFDSFQVAVKVHGDVQPDWNEWEERRRSWIQQFVLDFGTDENDESTDFNGSIPQALMMMNGTLIREALNVNNPGILKVALASSRDDAEIVRKLFLALLGRNPSPREISAARHVLGSNETLEQSCQDLLWALLNSNEFISNH